MYVKLTFFVAENNQLSHKGLYRSTIHNTICYIITFKFNVVISKTDDKTIPLFYRFKAATWNDINFRF